MLDMNQVPHLASIASNDRPIFVLNIYRSINQKLRSCKPRKPIYFAVGTPALLAMLVTQQQRRRIEMGKSTSVRKTGDIDREERTPGVALMTYVCAEMYYWAQGRLKSDRSYTKEQMHISGAEFVQEVELKLIYYFHVVGFHTEDSFCVVCRYADIVWKGLATTHINNFFVFLYRTRIRGGKKKKPRNLFFTVWEFTRRLEGPFVANCSAPVLTVFSCLFCSVMIMC